MIDRRLFIAIAVFCLALQSETLYSQPLMVPRTDVAETQAQRDQRMRWWREARFGMFIHWGLYAVPAGEYNGKRSDRIGEWIMEWANIPRADYEKFTAQFNPVKFDAKEWVRIAKDAGMVRISDARMSGTSYGACVLHVSPESFIGGPLALVQNDDLIELDVPARRLDLIVDDEELTRRRAVWQPQPAKYERGFGALYSSHVLQADQGCDFDFLLAGAETPEPEIHH